MTDQSLTFEEAYDALNRGQTIDVARAMEEWHPTILAEMLLAVGEAKKIRYPGQHADYTRALNQLVEAEAKAKALEYLR